MEPSRMLAGVINTTHPGRDHMVVLVDNMFAADVMVAEAIAFEEMKVRELKGELMARGAASARATPFRVEVAASIT